MNSPVVSSETFFIAALDCPDELALIETGLASVAGISGLAPNYLQRSLRVEFDPQRTSAAAIAERLRQIGFPGEPASARAMSTGGANGTNVTTLNAATAPRLRTTTLVGGLFLAVAFAVQFSGLAGSWLPVLAVVSTLLSSGHVAGAAWRALRLLRLDMNALMAIAAAGALATAPKTNEWLEAPTAMFLFGVSLWIESFSLGRARRAVQTLVELTPAIAHRIDDHDSTLTRRASEGARGHTSLARRVSVTTHVTDVSPEELQLGDRLLVKPGERVPVDGEVVAGNSAVNEAPITGESLPLEKSVGDRVFAGSLNAEGALEIRATSTARDSTLAHIGRLVEKAQATRSPTERFVDQFARRYTPAVLALALALAFGPPLAAWVGIGGTRPMTSVEWFDWLHRGLVLLVIACPCALVISTPVTIVCGLHQATRLGAIIKGGEFLERLGQVFLDAGKPELARAAAA